MLGLSPALSGALAGAILGFLALAVLLWVSKRVERDATTPEQKRAVQILRGCAWVDVFLFTGVGYFIGPMIFA